MNSKSSRKKRDKRKGGTSTESKEITMRVGHGNVCFNNGVHTRWLKSSQLFEIV